MSRPAEELVRPFQLQGTAQTRIPVDASLTNGKTGINGAEVDDPGVGYQVDEIGIFAGGAGTAAIARIAEVDGDGGIVKVTLDSPGSYTILPSSPAFFRFTDGAGEGATFTVSGAGSGWITHKYGATGKLPSPVSSIVGISFCNEDYQEVPNTRETHNVKIRDDTNSGAFITVARTDSLTMRKKHDKTMLDQDAWQYGQVNTSGLTTGINSSLPGGSKYSSHDDGWTDKCGHKMRFHWPTI